MMMMSCFCGMVDRRKASFPAGTIVRDPYHRESSTRRKQDLNLSSGFVEWSCALVITTTPRRHIWDWTVIEIEEWNWTIIFYEIFFSFSVNWNNTCFFPEIGKRVFKFTESSFIVLLWNNFNILMDTLSYPWTLLVSSVLTILYFVYIFILNITRW